jgi:hypothetical protein
VRAELFDIADLSWAPAGGRRDAAGRAPHRCIRSLAQLNRTVYIVQNRQTGLLNKR